MLSELPPSSFGYLGQYRARHQAVTIVSIAMAKELLIAYIVSMAQTLLDGVHFVTDKEKKLVLFATELVNQNSFINSYF
jgi:hypothetical protein